MVHDVVKIGPLAKEAKQIKDYFKNPKHARLHLVTLPEELVVNETLELGKDIEKADGVKLGSLIINRVLPLQSKDLTTLSLELKLAFPTLAIVLGSRNY